MKKILYSVLVMACIAAFTACSKDDDHNNDYEQVEKSLPERAVLLGYDDVDSYLEDVSAQCAEGCHQNCDIYEDGTHHPCEYKEHAGTKHDGTHHNGMEHGIHHGEGHKHQNGNHHNDGHHNNK